MANTISPAQAYAFSSQSSLVGGLFSSKKTSLTGTVSSVLNSLYSNNLLTETDEGTSSFESFIKEYVPNNESLLADLSSVLALSSAINDQTIVQPFAFDKYRYLPQDSSSPLSQYLQSNQDAVSLLV